MAAFWDWLNRDKRRTAWGVFFLALALRLGWLAFKGPPPEIYGDALEYRTYAFHLLDEGRYAGPNGERATRMPGYPLFLAAASLLAGRSTAGLLVLQCVLGAFTCLLIFGSAEELLPSPWPIFCGAMSAVYFGLVDPCTLLLSECLYSFFLAASLRALFQSAWPPGRRALAFGLLSGCLYLVRPEPLPYILAVSALLPWLIKSFRPRDSALALTGLALVAGLWVGRNFLLFGHLVPASSVGKTVFYQALYFPLERQGLPVGPMYSPPPGTSELDKEAASLAAWKALFKSLSWKTAVKSYGFNLATILYPFLPGYDWSYVLLVPFWLLGFYAAVRKREYLPMAAAVACSLSLFIFFGGPASRYRQGVAPCLILLSAAGLESIRGALAKPRLRLALASWLGANLLIWVFQPRVRQIALGLKAAVYLLHGR